MDREKLLMSIMETEFACLDLRLYLNTHPCDKESIATYNYLTKESSQLRRDFESMYGPLTYLDTSNEDYFSWVDSPWTWEKSYLKGEKL